MRARELGSGAVVTATENVPPAPSKVDEEALAEKPMQLWPVSQAELVSGVRNIKLTNVPRGFACHSVVGPPQFVRSWKLAAAPESPLMHAGGVGPAIPGEFAALVRLKVSPSQTTIKLENAGVVLSYVNDPDVGNVPVPENEIV